MVTLARGHAIQRHSTASTARHTFAVFQACALLLQRFGVAACDRRADIFVKLEPLQQFLGVLILRVCTGQKPAKQQRYEPTERGVQVQIKRCGRSVTGAVLERS